MHDSGQAYNTGYNFIVNKILLYHYVLDSYPVPTIKVDFISIIKTDNSYSNLGMSYKSSGSDILLALEIFDS